MSGWKRLAAMARKETYHMMRDPYVIGISLVMPVVMIFLFGYAVSFDVEHIDLVVADQDATSESRDFARSLTASDVFRDLGRISDPAEADRLFRRGVARAVLVIPRGFGRNLVRGGRIQAQLLLDGSDNVSASQAQGYFQLAAALAARRKLAESGPGPGLSARVRVFFNPALKSALYLVPGLMVVVMTLLGVILTALTVAREWEQGSIEMLLVTMAKPPEILAGKLLPYFLLGMLQVLLVVTTGAYLFDVPLRGPVWILAAGAAVFLTVLLAQGLFISTVTRNQLLGTLAAALSTMLPSLILSDFVFPVRNMPKILVWLAHALPPYYFVRTLRSVMIRGQSLAAVAPDLLALAGFACVFAALSVFVFKRRLG